MAELYVGKRDACFHCAPGGQCLIDFAVIPAFERSSRAGDVDFVVANRCCCVFSGFKVNGVGGYFAQLEHTFVARHHLVGFLSVGKYPPFRVVGRAVPHRHVGKCLCYQLGVPIFLD